MSFILSLKAFIKIDTKVSIIYKFDEIPLKKIIINLDFFLILNLNSTVPEIVIDHLAK